MDLPDPAGGQQAGLRWRRRRLANNSHRLSLDPYQRVQDGLRADSFTQYWEKVMAVWYPWIVLIHLSCAILFVGSVAFEVLVIESLHRHFDGAIMQRIEQAVMARARRFMPLVVILLFASGGMLFDIRCAGISCIGTRFGNLLLLKMLLAFGVLGVFVNAMRAMRSGRMNVCRFRHTHRVVLGLMIGIVFLAKIMFYL
ncbi:MULTISPECIES: hypothetical protein [unclassified Rhodanobacter]|nr:MULTISPECIES: hypothetical protein [unclassified Rhodanobacter]